MNRKKIVGCIIPLGEDKINVVSTDADPLALTLGEKQKEYYKERDLPTNHPLEISYDADTMTTTFIKPYDKDAPKDENPVTNKMISNKLDKILELLKK